MDSERRRMGWGEAAVVNCCAEQPFFKGRPGLGKAVLSLPRELCSKRTSLSRPLFRNEEEAALLKNCDGSRVLSQHQESVAQIQQYPTQYPLISSIVLFCSIPPFRHRRSTGTLALLLLLLPSRWKRREKGRALSLFPPLPWDSQTLMAGKDPRREEG